MVAGRWSRDQLVVACVVRVCEGCDWRCVAGISRDDTWIAGCRERGDRILIIYAGAVRVCEVLPRHPFDV